MHPTNNKSFPAAVLNRIIEVNGIETTVREFVAANFYKPHSYLKGNEKLSVNQVREVIDLEPDETKQIANRLIKRIS